MFWVSGCVLSSLEMTCLPDSSLYRLCFTTQNYSVPCIIILIASIYPSSASILTLPCVFRQP